MTRRMVPASGSMIMLNYGVSRGLDIDALCTLLGYAPHQLTDPTRMVPFEVSLRMWRTLIAQLPDENVGVGIAQAGKLEYLGMFWEFTKYLSNGLELLTAFARFSVYGDTACIDDPVTVNSSGGLVELRWPASLKYGIPERTEALNVATLRWLHALRGVPIYPRAVRAANPVDRTRRIAEREYGCAVTWDSADDALCFDEADLLAPFPGADPRAAQALVQLLERKVLPTAKLPFGERVRRVVARQAVTGEVSQSAVAHALGLSVRSLQRGLQEVGLRYADVLSESLVQAAAELMLDRSRSLAEIAVELGYSEASSFSRTWKRLTGESPARYRARVLGASDVSSQARGRPSTPEKRAGGHPSTARASQAAGRAKPGTDSPTTRRARA